MSGRSAGISVATMLLMGLSAPAMLADPIVFAFEGNLVVDDPSNMLQGQTAFSGSYTFESTTPDIEPDLGRGFYADALTEFTFTVGPLNFTSESVGGSHIIVVNDPGFDNYIMSVDAAADTSNFSFGMFFQEAAPTLFASDALPLTAPAFDLFSSIALSGSYTSPAEQVFTIEGGDVTSFRTIVVPAPGAVLLGVVGLLLTGWFGRRS